ncbi:MAG: secretion protein [Oceanospirillaceae bacterium]|nr:secretion protein [Oceanospirillaceae bacterium]MBT10426.1 secretion protein [Oceanospirillaceae bacterium]|tara:strand:+ start:13995 stop:15329 length:1335 start_codon:yes stop_codon:yes gene_type:complete
MKKILSLTTALLASGVASAADLSTIYEQAASNDAEIAAARATREADAYNVTIARGALLPQAQVSYNHTEISADLSGAQTPGGASVDTDSDYDRDVLQLSASQTLFNLNSWYTYQAARTGDEASELTLQMSEQQLLLRTAQAYFDVLRAKDNLSTAQAEEQAVKRSLEQTKQRFDVGLIAITEVHEAQATYDLTYVNLLGMESSLDISYEALEQLTGQRFDQVDPLRDEVPMEMPEPADASAWVDSGMDKYAGLLLAEANKDAVRLQRNATRSNHLPTVTLSGAYMDGDQQSMDANGDPYDGSITQVGIEVSMPLLAGGSLYGQSKQAALNYAAADYQLEQQRRALKQNIRSLFRQVKTDVLNIKARKQAIKSAESALEAAETGYRVGTRNIVEVLDAKRNVFSAQRDYANARYDYIINLMNLKFYAGTLNEGDIQLLNSWLKAA